MKLAYDFIIYKYITLQVNGGIQNIANAYQRISTRVGTATLVTSTVPPCREATMSA